jgi:tRNA(Ile)-lysidine synthase
LTSIKPKNEEIIRPLLFASRAEIETFAGEYKIPFREDSSNKSNKYLRNYIRHKILPSFEDIFPNFRETLTENIAKLTDLANIYDYSMNLLIPEIFTRDKKLAYINIPALLANPAPRTILFEILSEFGFTPPSIAEIFDSCNSTSGKQFYSASYKLIKDRDVFIVSHLESSINGRTYIDENIPVVNSPLTLEFEVIEKTKDFEIINNRNIALLDYDKITFPIILRKWIPGDYFIPLGMKGIKKLSDFFIDQKMSLIDKENAWILTSGPDIFWIIGKRLDNRFKITPETKRILQITYIPK